MLLTIKRLVFNDFALIILKQIDLTQKSTMFSCIEIWSYLTRPPNQWNQRGFGLGPQRCGD